MHDNSSTETLSNLEIAHRQLERSIVLFLDDRDYVSAITLAGAAEVINGVMINVINVINGVRVIDFAHGIGQSFSTIIQE